MAEEDRFELKLDVKQFWLQVGRNLRTKREEQAKTQLDLAVFLQCDDSLISKWEKGTAFPGLGEIWKLCRYYQCSFDELLGEENAQARTSLPGDHNAPQIEFTHVETSSHLKTPTDAQDREYGVEILTASLAGGTLTELYKPLDRSQYAGNRDTLFALLRSAVISGEIAFTHVPFSTALQEQLVEKYPQLNGSVYVVDLPENIIEETLPPELVAWAAAHFVLSKIDKPSRVGLGYGYTLHRMCLITPPKVQQFNGTRWIPLITYSGEEEATINSANYLAALMKYRHHKSIAGYLPYISPETRAINKPLEDIRREWEGLDVAFVGGYGWNKATNFRVAGSYRRIYRKIENEGRIDTIAGEFLGYILDKDGTVRNEDEADLSTTRIPLEDIQACVRKGKVYFVGCGMQKTPVVRVALEMGYINGLITENSLAKELLK